MIETVLTFEEIKFLRHQNKQVTVETSTGFEQIGDVIEKYMDGYKISLSNGKTFVGASTHKILMTTGMYENLGDVQIGDVTSSGILITGKEFVAEQRWIDFQVIANHSSYIQSGIVHHNTGKSLIIYLLCRYFQLIVKGRVLLLVPNVGLVEQMFTDFRDYSQQDKEWKVFHNVSKIYAGQSKTCLNDVVISTWQSLQKIGKSKEYFPKEWFEQFAAIIVDEVHLADGAQIKRIVELCYLAEYRVGLSGTLDKDDLSDHTVRGLLGPVTVVQTTKQAMQDGYLAKLNIKQIILKYPRGQKKLEDYQEEVDFVCAHMDRNKFLVNLVCSLKGNSLILVDRVAKHSDVLIEQIRAQAGNRKVFYINGSVSGEDRNEIRAIVEKETDAIILATYGSFSTGSNVKNIHNVILGSSSKSMVRVLQTIGRGLRTSKTKFECNLYDIVDYIRSKCFSLRHADERLKLYKEEGFTWTTINVNI